MHATCTEQNQLYRCGYVSLSFKPSFSLADGHVTLPWHRSSQCDLCPLKHQLGLTVTRSRFNYCLREVYCCNLFCDIVGTKKVKCAHFEEYISSSPVLVHNVGTNTKQIIIKIMIIIKLFFSLHAMFALFIYRSFSKTLALQKGPTDVSVVR